jgi:CO dehydrogenase maturation factor
VQKTVDGVRLNLIQNLKQDSGGDRREMKAWLDYEVFSALVERKNLAFLAIGRPEQDGCYCQVNRLLKDIIAAVARNFDAVVIDCEAGVEQINRRVIETVSHLVLVSDASVKGLQVAGTIQDLAPKTIPYKKSGLILNRLRGPEERKRLTIPAGLNCLGWVPEADMIRDYDLEGKSFLDMPDGPPVRSVASCMKIMGLIG